MAAGAAVAAAVAPVVVALPAAVAGLIAPVADDVDSVDVDLHFRIHGPSPFQCAVSLFRYVSLLRLVKLLVLSSLTSCTVHTRNHSPVYSIWDWQRCGPGFDFKRLRFKLI